MPARNPLTPTFFDRIRQALRPGWTRSLLLRRVCAGVLLVVAVVAAASGGEQNDLSTVVIANHDLTPGSRLTSADVTTRQVDPAVIPAGAITEPSALTDSTVTGPVRTGEIFTNSRVLSSRLPMDLLGRPDARLVPVKLSDTAIVELLREGDVVDVLSIDESGGDQSARAATVLVKNAVVALVSAPTQVRRTDGSRLALLAMPERDAHTVASATLASPITVVFH
ncbi:SAF domain-containing protein [Williamsia soli]|uniref:SAF domain-containing protein n=1 Tax=Williamsia soli TaxID=364929 RepID=UPI001A9E3E2B|nr:SAF domain-containing protein [Williamsia soli]